MFLLAQFMTGVAARGGLIDLVAIDAPLHLHGLLGLYHFLQHHFAMATLAFDFGEGMFGMAEEYKVGRFIYTA